MFQDPKKVFAFLKTAIDSNTMQMALTPFRMFSNLVLSQTWLEIGLWSSLCVAANAFVVFLITKTDKDFMEKEIYYSQLRLEAQRKTANIEAAFASTVSSPAGTLPMLPHWYGSGPIAWRQFQTFYRTKKLLLVGMVFYFAFIIFF